MWTQYRGQTYQVPPTIIVSPISDEDGVWHARSVASCDYDAHFRALQLTRRGFGLWLSAFLAAREKEWRKSGKSVAWRKAYLDHLALLAQSDRTRLCTEQDEDPDEIIHTEDNDYTCDDPGCPCHQRTEQDEDLDEIIHTEENGYRCGDPSCPCHQEVGE